MTTDLQTLMASVTDRMNAGDPDAFYDLVAEDCVMRSPLTGEVRGRDLILAMDKPVLEQMDPHWRRMERTFVTGDHVVAWGVFGGTVKATGKSFESQACIILRFEDGKIVEWQQYTDMSTAMDAWTPDA